MKPNMYSLLMHAHALLPGVREPPGFPTENADLATLLNAQESGLHNLEAMLTARWHASESLATLHNRTLSAFETAFPATEDVAHISMAQRQAALAHFKTLLLESDQTIQELLTQAGALIPALAMLGIEMPEGFTSPNRCHPKP